MSSQGKIDQEKIRERITQENPENRYRYRFAGVHHLHQRIFMDKELTVVPFVVTTSVFCCRKPEAIRKTTPEPLLAEW